MEFRPVTSGKTSPGLPLISFSVLVCSQDFVSDMSIHNENCLRKIWFYAHVIDLSVQVCKVKCLKQYQHVPC